MALKAFKTPAAASETEFVVNKSRFIGRAFPVETEAEALEILERIRQKHYDATHNCWAYNLRGASPLRRFSDDGEPGGTAGMPIMDTLIRSETENALIIVTRYFGGILLGSGGLVRRIQPIRCGRAFSRRQRYNDALRRNRVRNGLYAFRRDRGVCPQKFNRQEY